MRELLANEQGYARLFAAAGVLVIASFSAALYHGLYGFVADLEPQPDIKETVPTQVQVFPQTLPVIEDMDYLLEVIDREGEATTVSSFGYGESDVLTNDQGQVIQDGTMNLPVVDGDIVSARLSLYDDSNPRDPVIIPFLRGQFSNDRAVMTWAGPDFSQASGSAMLATPTDNNSLVNERSGAWFGNVVTNAPQLNLPELPGGWSYEGWANIDDRTLTTGRFTDGTRADDFNGFSDTAAPAPGFPGEDFLEDPPVAVFPGLTFPVDLTGDSLEITVEPDTAGIDPTGEAQFPTPVLRLDISRLAEARRLYEMETVAGEMPRATVVLR